MHTSSPLPGETYRHNIDEVHVVVIKRIGYYSGRLEIVEVMGSRIVGEWNILLPDALIRGLPLEPESIWEKEVLKKVRAYLNNIKAP